MAHFAKLNEDNIVTTVIVVLNDVLDSNNEEESGIAFLTEWSGGYTKWKQTSYNNTFRKRFASPGFCYDEMRDAFIPPQPYLSWIFNEETLDWEAPTPHPQDGNDYYWDETSKEWKQVDADA